MLYILKKHRVFANLKEYWFYKNKIYFYSYVFLVKKVKIKDK